jgi:hypothetical protein
MTARERAEVNKMLAEVTLIQKELDEIEGLAVTGASCKQLHEVDRRLIRLHARNERVRARAEKMLAAC